VRIEERDDPAHQVIDITTREPDVPAAHEPTPAPTRSRRRAVALTMFAVVGIIVAFFAYEFFASSLTEARSQRFLLQEFRYLADQGPATTLGWQPQPGDPIGIISIPRLGLEAVVIEGTSSSETSAGPGHYRGSVLPGRPGNSVIAGRRTTYGAPFAHLSSLVKGDQIQVATGVGEFTYLVTGITTIRPDEVDALNPSTDNRLTLITSDPPYRATGRLVVTAALVGAPAKAKLRPLSAIPQDETGLTGQPWAAAPLILWTEILIVAVVGWRWLRRHANSRVAWLLASPLVIAMIWAMFLALNRLLPATI
jgi:sortase A